MAANPLGTPEVDEHDALGLGAPDASAFEDAIGGATEQARADLHVQTVCLMILAFVAAGIALYLLRPVLVPFVLALFFAAMLKPLIELQKRYLRFPQPLAVVGALLVAGAILGAVGIPLASATSQMRPAFQQQFGEFLNDAAQSLPLQRLGINTPIKVSQQNITWIFSAIPSAVGEVTGVATATFLVVVFALFILLGRPGEKRKKAGMLVEIEARVQLYISQMVLLSAITGIAVGITLFALGVKYAAVFGFLAFLLNFIPTIGSIIATLLPLPVILLSPQLGPTAKILAIAIPAALQIYLGNAVQPRVLGNALDLHPIVILISLIFWGMIWGVPGAFLATPMTAVLRIVLEKIPATRPVAEVLAGRLNAVF
jgi:AI-2 transport protein TqsA